MDSRFQVMLSENRCEAILALDPANFSYLSGITLPYPQQFPLLQAAILRTKNQAADVVICPLEWVHLTISQGWQGQTVPCSGQGSGYERLVDQIASAIKDRKFTPGRIGLDESILPATLVELLKNALPQITWIDLTQALTDLRMIKSEAEIALLEEACRQADRAYVSALNHMEASINDPLGFDIWEFTERIRVHMGEFCGSGFGNLLTLQGEDACLFYASPRRGVLQPGNLVRSESTNHHRGYWSSSARTFVTGQPSARDLAAYSDNIALKNVAHDALLPGKTCKSVYQAVVDAAEEKGIEFWADPGIGHGVGVSEREAPFLTPDDDSILCPGMVVVLAVYTYGPKRELICSKDTYVITENGSRLLSWYRNWDKLYVVIGDSARHG